MATLYKRATPSQRRILKIVEGAVRNANDAHRWGLDDRAARSIAKRAAGTLSSQWDGVLAAGSRLSGRAGEIDLASRPQRSNLCMAPESGASQLSRRSTLLKLLKWLSVEAGKARRAGDSERLEVLVETLKMLDNLSQNG